MVINSDITGSSYQQFIQFAYKKSDAFMVVLRKHRAKIFRQTDWLKNFPNFVPDEESVKRYQIREQESKHDLNLFRTKCLPFMKRLEPFLLKTRHDGKWPSTEVCSHVGAENIDINIYILKPEILSCLLEPESCFNWMYPLYPEDLCFFKNHYCWAWSSTHEKRIEVLLNSSDEYEYLSNIGIQLTPQNAKEAHNIAQKEERFFEMY